MFRLIRNRRTNGGQIRGMLKIRLLWCISDVLTTTEFFTLHILYPTVNHILTLIFYLKRYVCLFALKVSLPTTDQILEDLT